MGGILLSAESGSVNANTYIIFVSLALVMLTVVGGIGSVAGALMGGILAGTAFQALTSTFTNLSTDHGGGGIWNVLANVSLVAPALIGISLGRNPSGAVPQIVASYRPLWQVKWVLALGVVAEGCLLRAHADRRHGELVVRAGHRRSSSSCSRSSAALVRPEAFGPHRRAARRQCESRPRCRPWSPRPGSAAEGVADARS